MNTPARESDLRLTLWALGGCALLAASYLLFSLETPKEDWHELPATQKESEIRTPRRPGSSANRDLVAARAEVVSQSTSDSLRFRFVDRLTKREVEIAELSVHALEGMQGEGPAAVVGRELPASRAGPSRWCVALTGKAEGSPESSQLRVRARLAPAFGERDIVEKILDAQTTARARARDGEVKVVVAAWSGLRVHVDPAFSVRRKFKVRLVPRPDFHDLMARIEEGPALDPALPALLYSAAPLPDSYLSLAADTGLVELAESEAHDLGEDDGEVLFSRCSGPCALTLVLRNGRAKGHLPRWKKADLRAGETVDVLLPHQRESVIQGRVVDERMHPIAGARLRFSVRIEISDDTLVDYDAQQPGNPAMIRIGQRGRLGGKVLFQRSVRSGVDGSFRVLLPPGPRVGVQVTKSEFRLREFEFANPEGGEVTMPKEIVMASRAKTPEKVLRFIDSEGQPLAGVQFKLLRFAPSHPFQFEVPRLDEIEPGVHDASDLIDGQTYIVSMSKPDAPSGEIIGAREMWVRVKKR